MRYRHWLLAVIAAGLTQAPASAQRGDPPPLPAPIRQDRPAPPPAGYDVQTRGPVHEAFLQPTDTHPPPRVVPQPPPADVQESPPEERPDGGVVWVGGYWAWDDERNQFIWVSGCWRAPPPDRVWLPGRWQQAAAGWQWVAGAWLPDEPEEVQLLPPPPPPPPPPERPPELAEGQIFVPGCWVFRADGYAWRPGFPLTVPAGWVWTNARYITTPAGSLFVEGHWDLPVHDRGLLFAPVTFPAPAARQRIEYVPHHVVGATSLLGSLFVSARTGHYYFGDYFEQRYRQAGYVPWFQHRVRGVGANPLYGYYRKNAERGWVEGVQGLYASRYSGAAPRPAWTLDQQHELLRRHPARPEFAAAWAEQLAVVSPLDQYARHGHKLTRVAPDERTYYQQAARDYAQAARQFQRFEQEFLAQGRPVPAAPVAVPFQPWPRGHPHGMPPGQAKKLQAPAFPVPRFDDDHGPGQKPKKPKKDKG